MQFPTGSSTTFAHCAVKKCLYHATPDGEFCKKHKNFEAPSNAREPTPEDTGGE